MTSGSKTSGKNIVLCFDGTGDWVAVDKTNVSKIFDNLDRKEQCCFYDGGIGTVSDTSAIGNADRTILLSLDLATATRLGDKVLRGYLFLVENFHEESADQEADKIYLFGFSRGAYTARIVASMIHNFGVLRADCRHLAPYLWQAMLKISLARENQKTIADHPVVRDTKKPARKPKNTPADSTAKKAKGISAIGEFKRTANSIKKRFSRPTPRIAFMGLFDTVSSIGIIGRFATFPNTDRNNSVERVCHAVSIDEQRNFFPESLIHPQQIGLTEVWFPGVHRDIGGGASPEDSRISDETLRWIAIEAQSSGLVLTGDAAQLFVVPEDGPALPDDQRRPAVVHYPAIDPYVVAGLYPMLMFNGAVSAHRYLWPNLRHNRSIPKNALVYKLACDLADDKKNNYAPPNLPPPNMRVCFQIGDTAKGPVRNDVTWNKPGFAGTLADFLGTIMGAGLLSVLANIWLGRPFGSPWPVPTVLNPKVQFPYGCMVSILIAGFLLVETFGVKFLRKLRVNSAGFDVLLALIADAVATFVNVKPPYWPVFAVGVGVGLLFFVLAQFPPLPTMRANRILPYILLSVIRAAAAGWAASEIAHALPDFIRNSGTVVLERVLGSHIVDFLSEIAHQLPPFGQFFGLVWLGISLLFKLMDIVLDRKTMRRVELENNPVLP